MTALKLVTTAICASLALSIATPVNVAARPNLPSCWCYIIPVLCD